MTQEPASLRRIIKKAQKVDFKERGKTGIPDHWTGF